MANPIDTKDNKALLFKYLTKQYQREKGLSLTDSQDFAEYIMRKRKNDLFTYHGLAYELGSKNIEFFCLFYLSEIFTGEDKAEIAPIHVSMWLEIENIVLRKSHDKQAYVLPRGIGKSSFISLVAAIWCSLYKYKRYTLICSAIGDTAQTFIRNIKLAMENNQRIEQSFGKIYDSKKYINNSEQIEFANKTMVQSISASSTMRGKSYGNIRVELAILDDYQKDDEISTHQQREAKWKKFNDDVNYAIQKGNSTLLACGTLQHPECFYSRLMNSPIWKNRSEKGVLVDDVDELFNNGKWEEFKKILLNKDDENRLDNAKEFYFQNIDDMQYPMLWQSYWDCLDMALNYYGNPASFKQEVQGDVNSIGVKRFNTIVTESALKIDAHTFSKTMLCIDPAASNATKKKADYSAFAVGGISDTGIKYIRKGEVLKIEFEDYINHTLKLLRDYTDITHVYIEKNLYMGTDVLRLKDLISKDDDLKNRKFTWINEMQRTNKDDKINTIVADVNFGRIIFNETDTEAIEQLKEFAGCDYSIHDDFPDIVAEFAKRIDEIQATQYVTFLRKSALF